MSIIEKARSVANGMKKVGAQNLLAVQEHGFDGLSKWRMGICRPCPKFKEPTQQCNVCGCFMDIKVGLATNRNPHAMGRIEVTHCPEGRWNDAHIANIYREIDEKPLLEMIGQQ